MGSLRRHREPAEFNSQVERGIGDDDWIFDSTLIEQEVSHGGNCSLALYGSRSSTYFLPCAPKRQQTQMMRRDPGRAQRATPSLSKSAFCYAEVWRKQRGYEVNCHSFYYEISLKDWGFIDFFLRHGSCQGGAGREDAYENLD